jgi:myo-inositol-1(or 4)-monophosphatase
MTSLLGLSENIINKPELWSRDSLHYSLKEDGSPVTDSDIRLDAYIGEALRAVWPDIFLVSEEREIEEGVGKSNFVGVIDSLDGTENYLSGIPLWGVSVSVWVKGSHHESLLLFPEINKRLISGEESYPFKSRIHGWSSSWSSLEERLPLRSAENRILGCATYNLFCVTTGRLASYRSDSANVWDILAGINIALEHGCEVKVDGKAYRGEFLDPNRKYSVLVSR